jgi:Fur family transcriptional regulator, ferric uptake regulator
MAPQSIHRQEKEQFIKLFEKDRIDRFEDRLAILEVFLCSEHHVTLQALGDLVRQNGHDFSGAFILETIELMCHYGFAQANRFDNGQIHYEHRHLGQHHDHLICTKCQKIVEFEDNTLERLQIQIANAYGFHILQHKMELYGICRECLNQREPILTLDAARPGERLKIVDFIGGVKFKLRLLTMGLRVGDQVEIITNMHHGQVVLAVDFKRLVLGQGLSKKIRVIPIEAAGPQEKKWS